MPDFSPSQFLTPQFLTPEPEPVADPLGTLRDRLKIDLIECRSMTFQQFEDLTDEVISTQAHPDFSPAGWHLGHIAYTESLWLLERCAGCLPQFPQYSTLLAADGLPKEKRQELPHLKEFYHYLQTIRTHTLSYLEFAPLDQQERLWQFMLQHESQHGETVAIVLALLNHHSPLPPSTSESVSECSSAKVNHQFSSPEAHPPQSPLAKGGSSGPPPLQGGVRGGNSTAHIFPRGCTDRINGNETYPPTSSMVHVPAGRFTMGYDGPDALDNERPAHPVHLEDYWIDPYPVTYGEFDQFIQAGGYDNPQWWSEVGWQWRSHHTITHPLYWPQDQVSSPLASSHPSILPYPVCGVSWYEADAYARFVGKRLPSEAEWEKAARWHPITGESNHYPWGNEPPDAGRANYFHGPRYTSSMGYTSAMEYTGHLGHLSPVNAHPRGQSLLGCGDLLGNVWEWTGDWFAPYDGFKPYPYRGYSQTYFDQQHRVLKGGSWATRRWGIRSSFRNWYHPHVRQIFAGFRCATSSIL